MNYLMRNLCGGSVGCEEKREKLRIIIVGGNSILLDKNVSIETLGLLNESEINKLYILIMKMPL